MSGSRDGVRCHRPVGASTNVDVTPKRSASTSPSGADAERLRRVVARVENDDSQLSCLDGGVMRTFAHDQRVESLGGGFAQRCRVRAGAGADAPCARHAISSERRGDELSAVLLGQCARPSQPTHAWGCSRFRSSRRRSTGTSRIRLAAPIPAAAREARCCQATDGRRAVDAPHRRRRRA